MASKTIWVTFNQDGEMMDAFKKKPTLKFIVKWYQLDEMDMDDDIARDIYDSIQSVKLH